MKYSLSVYKHVQALLYFVLFVLVVSFQNNDNSNKSLKLFSPPNKDINLYIVVEVVVMVVMLTAIML